MVSERPQFSFVSLGALELFNSMDKFGRSLTCSSSPMGYNVWVYKKMLSGKSSNPNPRNFPSNCIFDHFFMHTSRTKAYYQAMKKKQVDLKEIWLKLT